MVQGAFHVFVHKLIKKDTMEDACNCQTKGSPTKYCRFFLFVFVFLGRKCICAEFEQLSFGPPLSYLCFIMFEMYSLGDRSLLQAGQFSSVKSRCCLHHFAEKGVT